MTAAQQQLTGEVVRAGRSATTKLQPGIIRMVSPKAVPATLPPTAGVVTKVDVGTSITPVKPVPPPSMVAAVSGTVSRRLQLPEEEPASLVSATKQTVIEEETDEVSLECQEVFDDSFEKSSENEAASEAVEAAVAGGQLSKENGEAAGRLIEPPLSASQSDVDALDLLKPLPERVPDDRGPPLEVRTNEFGLVEVVTPVSDKTASTTLLKVRISVLLKPHFIFLDKKYCQYRK